MTESTGPAVVDVEEARPVGEYGKEAPPGILHASRAERRAVGKAARQRTPLEAHAEFPTGGRADPVDLLESQAPSRVPELVPIRYGRMLTSSFGFYRGAALVMAADLARTPSSGLRVQLCGDAHMSNFGIYASPERRLVFDVNDFDETHPGPFEWDVKRLAASLAVAGRVNGFSRKQRHKIARAAAAGYREAMTAFAGMGNLAVWYTHLDMDEVLKRIGDQLDTTREKRAQKLLDKWRTHDSVQALAKLTTQVDGRARIVSQPPLVVPVEELFPDQVVAEINDRLGALVRAYRRTLQRDRRHLLEQFELVQVARKVVGVGSVGTRAWILLFEGIDGGDPLFLQAKEAQPSVLSGFVKAPEVQEPG